MEVQKLYLPVAGEQIDQVEVNVQVPSGFDVGTKDGETVLFRRKPKVVRVREFPEAGPRRTSLHVAELRLVVNADDRRTIAVSAESPALARKALGEALFCLAMTGELPGEGGANGMQAEWRAGIPVQASPEELTEELKPTGHEPITANEVAGPLGPSAAEVAARFDEYPLERQAQRCEQCRLFRGEGL